MEPRTDWTETVAPDEGERFERYAAELAEMQKKNAVNGKPGRALHAKGVASARAEFHVLDGLPEPYRVGLFAQPGTHKAWVRYSNGSGGRQHDRTGDVRGLSIKVVGVPGKKLIPGLEDARTQDFLLIHTPTVGFVNADEFLFFVRAAASPLTLLPRLLWRLGVGRTFKLLGGLRTGTLAPVHSVATLRYWTPLPVRWGKYAAKFGLRPRATDIPAERGTSQHYLAEELAARLAKGPVEYDFFVQLYVDPARTPIEDPSVEWTVEDSPPVDVARLVLPQQELTSAQGVALAAWVEELSFDPWHAPEEFRPLGDMMRARSPAYRVSTQGRKAAAEPDEHSEPPAA